MLLPRNKIILVLVATALAACALYLMLPGRGFRGLTLDPVPAPDFALSAAYRGPVTLSDFRGDVVLLTFGRPSCGTACNPQLPTLQDAMSRLEGRRHGVRVLFVTLEPRAMNEQGLLAFVQDYDLGFVGLRSDSAAVHDAADAYRRAFLATPDSVLASAATITTGPTGDAVGLDIDSLIYGIDRSGVLRVVWGPGDPAVLARDVRALLRY